MSRRLAPVAAAALVALGAAGAAAQAPPIDLSPFYHAVTAGAGARAWGMAGAQVALSDSAEAVTWNPAAAAALPRPSALAVFSGDQLTGEYDDVRFALPSGPTGSITPGPTTAGLSRLQALQVAYPFRPGGRGLVLAGGYRRRLALPAQTDATYLFRNQSLYRFDYDYSYRARGTGGFDTIDLSVASDLGHGFRAGATVHRWFGAVSSSYRESYRYTVANYYGWDGTWTEDFSDHLRIEMSGFSFDLGAQFTVGDRFLAGLVFRTGTAGDISYSNAPTYEETHTGRRESASHSGSGTLTLPSSLGLGVGARISDRLTLAADAVRDFWAGAGLEGYARATALGDVGQAVPLAYPTGTPTALGPQSDTWRTSFGGEYVLDAGPVRIPLRGGVSWQQRYSSTGSSGLGAAAGGGIRWRGLVLDAAWVGEAAAGRYNRQSFIGTIGWTF